MGIFDSYEVETSCDCGSTVRVTLGRLRRSNVVVCDCGNEVEFAGNLSEALERADASVASFRRTLRRR